MTQDPNARAQIEPTEVGANAAETFARSFAEGVSQDIPIWENKIYRDRPVLTKGEQGIVAHRKWAEQFYT